MAVAPKDATTISVLDTLRKLDNDFVAMAAACEKGEFALWVGSGISRKALVNDANARVVSLGELGIALSLHDGIDRIAGDKSIPG